MVDFKYTRILTRSHCSIHICQNVDLVCDEALKVKCSTLSVYIGAHVQPSCLRLHAFVCVNMCLCLGGLVGEMF